MAAELPLCQYPPCRSAGRRMTLLGEQADAYVFGCYACGCARVITKPQTRAAARHMEDLRRRSLAAQPPQAVNHKRFVFLRG